MTAPRHPSTVEHVFEAGGSDPDFYFPPTQTASAGPPNGSFFSFVRSLPGRLARSLRG
jgi:hypothetical protein